jgi:hypothetical protein
LLRVVIINEKAILELVRVPVGIKGSEYFRKTFDSNPIAPTREIAVPTAAAILMRFVIPKFASFKFREIAKIEYPSRNKVNPAAIVTNQARTLTLLVNLRIANLR